MKVVVKHHRQAVYEILHQKCNFLISSSLTHSASVHIYLGDEDAVLLKQVVVVMATGQQLPDFGSEWLRDATANQ